MFSLETKKQHTQERLPVSSTFIIANVLRFRNVLKVIMVWANNKINLSARSMMARSIFVHLLNYFLLVSLLLVWLIDWVIFVLLDWLLQLIDRLLYLFICSIVCSFNRSLIYLFFIYLLFILFVPCFDWLLSMSRFSCLLAYSSIYLLPCSFVRSLFV